jgi:hypothetical protein
MNDSTTSVRPGAVITDEQIIQAAGEAAHDVWGYRDTLEPARFTAAVTHWAGNPGTRVALLKAIELAEERARDRRSRSARPKPDGWRQHDTPAARSAFTNAQTRLDEAELTDDGRCITLGVDNYTPEMRAADQATANRYDQLVLQPAHTEFERDCDNADFAAAYPEPVDGTRFEFEGDDGTLFAAFRQDDPDQPSDAHWYVYGDDQAWKWRDLVFRYQLQMADLELLQSAELRVDAEAVEIDALLNADGYPAVHNPVMAVKVLLNELSAAAAIDHRSRQTIAHLITEQNEESSRRYQAENDARTYGAQLTVALTKLGELPQPASWALPEPPGPKVKALRDANGTIWYPVGFPPGQWWTSPEATFGRDWYWILGFGPFTDATADVEATR